ncbi:integrase [Bradyrhizobium sp. GM6.1]
MAAFRRNRWPLCPGFRTSAKTVKDSDLAGLKTVFGWAAMNRRMASNPAEGLTIKIGKSRKLRSKGFYDQEASAILKHARSFAAGREAPKLAAAKRWVPWLCAFTGARVGEMLQLRKEDVRREGKHWVVHVTPEAGPVKTDEARDVVLHRQIIEEGFLEFYENSKSGYLFIDPKAGDLGVRKAVKTARNKVNAFVREVVKDPNVDPPNSSPPEAWCPAFDKSVFVIFRLFRFSPQTQVFAGKDRECPAILAEADHFFCHTVKCDLRLASRSNVLRPIHAGLTIRCRGSH